MISWRAGGQSARWCSPSPARSKRMNHDAVLEGAELLWTLWRDGDTVSALPPHSRPTTITDGWEMQRALDAFAGVPVGWKIAATSAAGQRHIGADCPVTGRLYDPTVVGSGASLDARGMTMRSAEAEFAFRLIADVDPADGSLTRKRILGAVGALIPAIEVPNSRFDDFLSVGLPSLVADAMCVGFLVIGEPVSRWEPGSLRPFGDDVVQRRVGRRRQRRGRPRRPDRGARLAGRRSPTSRRAPAHWRSRHHRSMHTAESDGSRR